MDSKAKVPLLLLCILGVAMCAGQRLVQGQEYPVNSNTASGTGKARQANLPQSFLLSPSEGLSVIGAALESRGDDRSTLDCSHLVHTVYERAGFQYSYVSSSELYAGAEGFHRVARPQPGDLVVWPGHVGIVVNPSQRTFFSALSSGMGVESYSSPYWKQRGVPRFYRYAKAASIHNDESGSEAAGLTRTALDLPANAPAMRLVEVNPEAIEFPRVQVIDSAKPQPEEITDKLLLALTVDPEHFRGADIFTVAQPVVVFSRLEVRAVKLHGNHGQVQVRITEPLSLAGGKTDLKTRQETRTWELRRRDRKSWELSLPQGTIYMPRDAAVHILARQLSQLVDTEESSTSLRQRSQLVQMLNTLFSDN
jgi:hypothetical protein